LLLLVCAVAPLAAQQDRTAVIHRDEWGAPHIFSATDEGVVFGMAYALAEDDWPLIEENYLHALRRAAEQGGEPTLLQDWFAHRL